MSRNSTKQSRQRNNKYGARYSLVKHLNNLCKQMVTVARRGHYTRTKWHSRAEPSTKREKKLSSAKLTAKEVEQM